MIPDRMITDDVLSDGVLILVSGDSGGCWRTHVWWKCYWRPGPGPACIQSLLSSLTETLNTFGWTDWLGLQHHFRAGQLSRLTRLPFNNIPLSRIKVELFSQPTRGVIA